MLTSAVKYATIIHTPAPNAALSTAGYAYQTAKNQQSTLFSEKGLQEAPWHAFIHPPRAMHRLLW